eukprot:8440307-Alexandrium_andersonii.AAC.1
MARGRTPIALGLLAETPDWTRQPGWRAHAGHGTGARANGNSLPEMLDLLTYALRPWTFE